MTQPVSLDPSCGEFLVLTTAAGPAAKMGHRLTIAMTSWRAGVQWRDDKPVSMELTVVVDSLEVRKGEGGLTPLSGPEKLLVRANALKSLDAKRYPQIRFVSSEITPAPDGYRLAGTLEIHGRSRPQTVDLRIENRTDTTAMSATVAVTQSAFGVKPYSLMMGTLKVADEVTVTFAGTYAR